MSDVRLTATNPEDSSAVPVACNDKGELLLQEIPDQSFDGDLEGDLTVTGDASVQGEMYVGNFDASSTSAYGVAVQPGGTIFVQRSIGLNGCVNVWGGTSETAVIYSNGSAKFDGILNVGKDPDELGKYAPGYVDLNRAAGTSTVFQGALAGVPTTVIKASGSARFGGYDPNSTSTNTTQGAYFAPFGTLYVNRTFAGNAAVFTGRLNGDQTSVINSNGSVSFASGKAGFTAEGYLWCTTQRGDTVMLDATSGGIGAWVAYTPETRRELLDEKISDIRDAAIKPSQDLPETETGTQ